MKIRTRKIENGNLVIEPVLDYPDELDEYKDASGWILEDLEDTVIDALKDKIRLMTIEEKPHLNIYSEVPVFTDLGDLDDFDNRQEWLNQDWTNHSWVDIDYMTDSWVQRLAENRIIILKVRRSS